LSDRFIKIYTFTTYTKIFNLTSKIKILQELVLSISTSIYFDKFYHLESICSLMAKERVNNPKTHKDYHIAEKDSKYYQKGQFTGLYENKKKK